MRQILLFLLVASIVSATAYSDINISNYTILTTPQPSMFYDANGYLNVLFFNNNGSLDYLNLVTISNSTVLSRVNISMNSTTYNAMAAIYPFGSTTIVRFNNNSNSTCFFSTADLISSCFTTNQTVTSSFKTTLDANELAYLDNITIPVSSSAFYPWITSSPAGENKSIYAYYQNGTTAILNYAALSGNCMSAVAWPTTPTNASLTNWYFWVEETATAGACDGTTTLKLKTTNPITNVHSTSVTTLSNIQNAKFGFARWGNQTYAYTFNASASEIYNIERNLTYKFNTTLNLTSKILFTNQDTFVFFANNNSVTKFAFICYFNTSASCLNMTTTAYGLLNTNLVFSSKRNGNSDYTTNGSASGTTFSYDEIIWDARFNCLDEQVTTNVKNFTVSILSDTASVTNSQSLLGYVAPSSIMGTGIKKTYMTCYNGTQREYLLGLTSNYVLTTYSLNLTLGSYYLFSVKNALGVVLPDTVVSAYRYDTVKSAYVVVEQGITDSTGSVTFYLQPLTNYIMIFEKSGYITLTTTFVPSTLSQIAITINQEAGFVQPMPNYNFPFGDVSFQITPTTASSTNTTNITFIVSSQSSALEYWGMSIIKINSTNTTLVYSNNQTGASGGILNYTAIENGTYVISVWIKHQNFSLYAPFPKTYSISPLTGFLLARERFNLTNPISGWAFYFLGIMCAMIAAGFVSRYSYEGASWIGLLILWGFALFFPAVIYTTSLGGTPGDLNNPGVVIEVTSVMATVLATIGVASITYLMKPGV